MRGDALILPGLNASLGLSGELSHLPTQTRNGLLQLVQIETHGADALINAGAEDTAFAHLVDQGIEQRGADPDAVGGRGGGRGGGLFHPRRRSDRRGLRGNHRRNSGDHRLQRLHRLAAKRCLQLVNQRLRRYWPFALDDLGQHLMEPIQGVLQCIQHGGKGALLSLAQDFQHRFGGMRQVADRHDARHARTALERVHLAAQIVEQINVIRFTTQLPQNKVAGIEHLGRLDLKDLGQFLVQFGQWPQGLGFRNFRRLFRNRNQGRRGRLNRLAGRHPIRQTVQIGDQISRLRWTRSAGGFRQHSVEAIQGVLQGIQHDRQGGLTVFTQSIQH